MRGAEGEGQRRRHPREVNSRCEGPGRDLGPAWGDQQGGAHRSVLSTAQLSHLGREPASLCQQFQQGCKNIAPLARPEARGQGQPCRSYWEMKVCQVRARKEKDVGQADMWSPPCVG